MREYTASITTEPRTDVLVVGSGPAGLAAAIAAARGATASSAGTSPAPSSARA